MPEHVARRWVETAVGTERALAQLVLAEVRAAAEDLAESELCLAEALQSDPTFALVPVVASCSLASTEERSAARSPKTATHWRPRLSLARDPKQLAREVEALLRARGDHLSPECTEVLLLDATLEAADASVREPAYARSPSAELPKNA